MEDSWIKRPVWGPAFENDDLEFPETTLELLGDGAAHVDDWYVVACGSEDGEFEVVETGLTLEEAWHRCE